MSTAKKNISYTVATELSPIELVLTPLTSHVIVGQPVVFTTQGSTSYDGSSIVITWEVFTPVGSSVESLYVSNDTSEATLFPDVTGMYKVEITATNDSGAVAVEKAYVAVGASNISLTREKPSSDLIQMSTSSFVSLINNREVIHSLWSEYIKLLAGDYRKLAELVLSKSIDNIQPGRITSNYLVNTQLDISTYTNTLYASESYFGTNTATTSSKNFLFKAIVVDSTRVSLVGSNVENIVGTTNNAILNIYSQNRNLGGKYTIKVASKNQVTLLASTPTLETTEVASISVSTVAGSPKVFSNSSCSVGQIISLRGDTYTVVTASSNGFFIVDKPLPETLTAPIVRLHTPVIISIDSTETGTTNKVYVPASEFGGKDKHLPIDTTVSFELLNANTVRAPDGSGAELIGASISVYSSSYSGATSRISNYYYNTTYDAAVFELSPPISLRQTDIGKVVQLKCKLKRESVVSQLLLTVDSISSRMLNVSYFLDAYNVPYASITLESKVPSGMINRSWRISSCIHSYHVTNKIEYYKEGVRYGDTLSLSISTGASTMQYTLQCTVVGAYKNIISFEPVTHSLVSEDGSQIAPFIEERIIAAALSSFNIPNVYEFANETYSFTGVASSVFSALPRSISSIVNKSIKMQQFSTDTSNPSNTIYITEGSDTEAIMRVCVAGLHITRNTYVPLKIDEPIASIPYLTEFVYQHETSSVENSNKLAFLKKDGSVVYRDQNETVLVENIGFYIQNNATFSSNTMDKLSGLVVTDLFGYFTTRGVISGDYITIDGVTYTIKTVVNSTTIEILKDATTTLLESKVFYQKRYTISSASSYSYPYIRFAPDSFSAGNPAPKSLLAPTVIVDNIRQVENNFGKLVGYTIKDFLDYSSPQMSYLNAVRGLMYVLANGPTVKNIELATAILLNLPVSQRTSRIIDIDKKRGTISLQPVDESATTVAVGQAEHYTFSVAETVSPFTGIAYNPITGTQYKIGDLVPKFTALTHKVVIEDAITTPTNTIGGLHTWKIYIDTNSVSTKDIPLLAAFYAQAKPIYTKSTIELVLFLVSTVKVLVSIRQAGSLFITDDPALSLELTHGVDSRANGSQVLRLLDVGELSSRTLIDGKDLKVTSTTTVRSARGGFLLNSQDDFTDDTGIGVTPDVKELLAASPFTGVHFARGKELVRPSDILRIFTGANAGVYNIISVDSDNELSIEPLLIDGVYSKEPVPSNYAQTFGIYRFVSSIIVDNIECTDVVGNTAVFSGATLNWDGVTVDDVVVDTTNHTVRHKILEVIYDPITEDAASTVITDSPLSVGSTYFIYRPFLVSDNYATGVCTLTTGRYVEHDIQEQFKIDVGDTIVVATDIGEETSKVVWVGNGYIETADILPLTTYPDFLLRKPGRPEKENSDSRLELLHGYDSVTISLISAAAIISAAAYGTSSGGLSLVELSGFGSLPHPCDKIYLYDTNGNTVYYGSVYFVTTNSVICITVLDSISNYNDTFRVSVESESKA